MKEIDVEIEEVTTIGNMKEFIVTDIKTELNLLE